MITNDIISLASKLYNDTDYDRVTEAMWLEFLNDAIRQTIKTKPSSYTTIGTVRTTAGLVQTIPTTALQLLNIFYNMGTDGLTIGAPVKVADKLPLDQIAPEWLTATAQNYTKRAIFDITNERKFFIYPPSNGYHYLQLEYSVSHATLSNTAFSETVDFSELYFDALVSWCLFRAFSLDTDDANNQKIAMNYKQSFYEALGIQMQQGGEA